MKTNQGGFASILLIANISFLAAILIVFLILRAWYLVSFDLKQLCRNELLLVQQQNIESLTSLFELNPIANALRLDLKIAKASLAAALLSKNPAAILAAEKHVQLIMQKKKSLDLQQKWIIQSANHRMLSIDHRLAQQLHTLFHKHKKILSLFVDIAMTGPQFNTPRLSVRPDQVPDLAPVYVTESAFTQKQAVHGNWSVQISTETTWAKNWLPITSKQTFSCQVSLKQKGRMWKKTLAVPAIKDRP